MKYSINIFFIAMFSLSIHIHAMNNANNEATVAKSETKVTAKKMSAASTIQKIHQRDIFNIAKFYQVNLYKSFKQNGLKDLRFYQYLYENRYALYHRCKKLYADSKKDFQLKDNVLEDGLFERRFNNLTKISSGQHNDHEMGFLNPRDILRALNDAESFTECKAEPISFSFVLVLAFEGLSFEVLAAEASVAIAGACFALKALKDQYWNTNDTKSVNISDINDNYSLRVGASYDATNIMKSIVQPIADNFTIERLHAPSETEQDAIKNEKKNNNEKKPKKTEDKSKGDKDKQDKPDEEKKKEECNDAQAPGKPTEKDGYIPPKNWDGKKVRHRRGYGYPDRNGSIWVPTGPGPLAHGGPHWDVIDKEGNGINIMPGGHIRGKK